MNLILWNENSIVFARNTEWCQREKSGNSVSWKLHENTINFCRDSKMWFYFHSRKMQNFHPIIRTKCIQFCVLMNLRCESWTQTFYFDLVQCFVYIIKNYSWDNSFNELFLIETASDKLRLIWVDLTMKPLCSKYRDWKRIMCTSLFRFQLVHNSYVTHRSDYEIVKIAQQRRKLLHINGGLKPMWEVGELKKNQLWSLVTSIWNK